MRTAIGDNLLPATFGLQKNLELIKRAGFDGVELWLGARPWFQPGTSDQDIAALLRKVTGAGLVVSHVSNTLDWGCPISSADPKIHALAMQNLRRQIEVTPMLGADAILVVAGLVTEHATYNDVYKRTVDSLRELADYAASRHVRIGCENCNAEQRFLLSPREFLTFLNDVNHPAVGIHLDLGNIHDTGFPEQWIEIMGPRITRIHVKDVFRQRGRGGKDPVYTNIFLGDNNWPAMRASLDNIGYDGWLIAEMEPYRYAPDQQLFDTSAALRRFIDAQF